MALLTLSTSFDDTIEKGRDLGRRVRRMTTRVTTFSLRLSVFLKMALEDLAEQNGSSLNQFLVMAATEKLSAMKSEEFFASRRSRADGAKFLRLLNREGGEPLRPEDSLD
jgi:hypothetical protein